jgi:hypothetical protein
LPAEDENEDVFQCVVCNKNFISQKRKNLHVCHGGRAKDDMLTAAIKYAHELVSSGAVSFISAREPQGSVSETIRATDLDFEDCLSDFSAVAFPRGWARRADYGEIYGAKYIDAYKEEIFDMFTAGEENKANKKGPGKMLDCLRRKYAGVLKLPSEIEIRQYVGSLIAKAKLNPGVKLTYKKRGVQKRFKDVISNIMKESEYQIKPTAALQKFKARCPRDEESMSTYPTDSQIKSYVSGMKNKRSFCETAYLLSSDEEIEAEMGEDASSAIDEQQTSQQAMGTSQ